MEYMNLTAFEKPSHQTFLRERYFATELLRQPGPRTLEENIAFVALSLMYGNDTRDIYDTSDRETRPPFENLWMPDTMFSDVGPQTVYNFNPFSPEGQCGPTNLNTALVYMWTELMSSEQIKRIYWEEGELWAAKNGEKTKMLGDHHAWFRLVAQDEREWRMDLTPYQYMPQNDDPNGHIRIVMQGVGALKTNTHLSGINWRAFESRDSEPVVVSNAHSLHYEPDPKLIVPLESFDWANGGGRAELLMGAMVLSPGARLGKKHNSIELDNNWYPDGYDHDKEIEGETREDTGEFKFKVPKISEEQAEELVRKSAQGEIELSVEALGSLLDALADQCKDSVLMNWAADCAERALPQLKDMVLETYLQEVINWARTSTATPSERNWALFNPKEAYKEDEHLTHILESVDYLMTSRLYLEKDPLTYSVGYFALSAARSAGMAVDFAAFENRVTPVPISERHWQYLHLYEQYLKQPTHRNGDTRDKK